MNQRQTDTLNLFLEGYEAKITTKIWADLNKCSKDTAGRDIQDLVQKGMLREDIPGAKRPSYSIVFSDDDLYTSDFTDVRVEGSDNEYYLCAIYKGVTSVRERILRLDAERYECGDLSKENMLAKYCCYIVKG